jgi:hypothetical protein
MAVNQETPPVVGLSSKFSSLQPMLLELWHERGPGSSYGQVSLSVPQDIDTDTMPYKDQLELGCGSFRMLGIPYTDRDFTKLITGMEFIQPVLDFLTSQGFKWCRPMIRGLAPKACLSYHRDDEQYRIHMPIETHWHAFFIVNDKLYRMPEVGHLYSLKTNVFHTAVNAHLTRERIHFTVTAYKE